MLISCQSLFNNPELTAQMLPSLKKAARKQNVIVKPKITSAEDLPF